jgi:hypothetical protein
MTGPRLLRGARSGSRNVLTVRKRASPGGDPGNVGGAGRPVPRTGAWPRRVARGASKARQLASRCGEAGQGPSISYMEGPCLILPGRNDLASTATACRAPPECATAIGPRSSPGTGQVVKRLRNPAVDGVRASRSRSWLWSRRPDSDPTGRWGGPRLAVRTRVRMSMIGRHAVDTRAAFPVKRRRHRCLLARSHPHRVRAFGVRASHPSPAR